ncbi:MAG: M36 family metallopeptidase [Acidobacteria bacterium]|nr:M36 family metallopeptidase [Acidobacteriota bacterium]
MFFLILSLTAYFPSLLAQDRPATHHLLRPGAHLTETSSLAPREIGRDFLRAWRRDIEITPQGLDGVYLHKEYRTAHNGVTHLIYRQRFQGIDVENAEWVINIDRDGRVLNAGGALYDPVAAPLPSSAHRAVRAAAAAVDSKAAERFQPFQKDASADGRRVRFHGGPMGDDIAGTLVWHAIKGQLTPAWRFTVTAADGITTEDLVVEPEGRRVLAQRSLTLQQSPAKPQGLVYEWSPIANPRPGYPREGEVQWVPRKLVSFAGDPAASPKGWVAGNETAGNNTVTGLNPLGLGCVVGPDNCPFRPRTAVAPNLDFSFPLEVGLNAPSPTAFPDASITSLFYLTNRVHDLFYAIGFDEAAGNFQAVNYSGQGMGGDPVYSYAQFGSAAQVLPSLNNASFSINTEDGTAPRMNMYINPGSAGQLPGFFTDGSLDSDVVFHEYTHGVSARLARQMYTTFQGGAMGEALSDFFALEFNVPDGAPLDGSYPGSEYIFFQIGRGLRTRPYSTDVNINPLTYADLGRVRGTPEVHGDGEIFVEALWEMRANLIKQFGEKEGRRRTRLLVVDGMKLAVPAASMIDMRDAILLADTVDFKGEGQDAIWRGFAKRGMGALAQSGSGKSLHVSASFDVPSNKASMRFYETSYVIAEPVRIVLQDANNHNDRVVVTVRSSSGDREQITLRRRGPVFLGTVNTNVGASAAGNTFIGIVPGDTITAAYADDDTGGGKGEATVTAETSYGYISQLVLNSPLTFPNETALNLRAGPYSALRYTLPFDFPFFENKQRLVFVYAGGLLSFTPISDQCFSGASLATIPAIAPMYFDIRTSGSTQPNENVYVSTTPDSITSRWAGETFPFSGFQAPDPVNFAATLYADGRIQFRYGSGNKNLAAGGQAFTGCPTEAPVIGLSNGHENYAVYPTLDGSGNLENAPTVMWHPPFGNLGGSDGVLELPAPGQVVDGVITVQGVAYESELSLGQPRLDILIDGRAIGNTAATLARPDYCRTSNLPRCPNVGFRRVIDPKAFNIAPGPHTIEMRATNWRATTTGFPSQPVPFILSGEAARLPEGAIETPRVGESVSQIVTVSGYAFARDLMINAIDVLVDGVTYGRASYNLARPDVCAANPAANCPAVGFSFLLNTRNGAVFLANGAHTMQIRVLDEAGRFTLIGTPLPFTVRNENTGPSKGVLVTPQANDTLNGVVRISGHAWDPVGRITGATLVIDGVGYGLPYGSPRPEECATLTDATACPNIGFQVDFNTKVLANGPHILGIRVTNDRGTVTTFPLVTAQGINVFVRNP